MPCRALTRTSAVSLFWAVVTLPEVLAAMSLVRVMVWLLMSLIMVSLLVEITPSDREPVP